LSAGWRNLLADLERVSTGAGRTSVGCFSIEGTRLHERALGAGIVPRAVLVGASEHARPSARVLALLERLRAANCRIEIAPDAELLALTEGRRIGALVGLLPLPEPASLGAVLAAGPRAGHVVLVAADVEDPGNVGALVRTALASGARAYVAVGTGDPFHPRAVRTSMGSVFRLPLIRLRDAEALLEQARALHLRTVAAVSRDGLAPGEIPRDRTVGLCVGSESRGLDPALAGRLDARVTIPMTSAVDSYSVNAAAAILLWELGPQRALRS